MILIGNNLNFSSHHLKSALLGRDCGPVQRVAYLEDLAGMDYLAMESRPDFSPSAQAMAWAAQTVRSVTSRPLVVGSAFFPALAADFDLLPGQVMVLSDFRQTKSWFKALSLAQKYDARVLARLPDGDYAPRDAYECCVLAMEISENARSQGIPDRRLWIEQASSPLADPCQLLKTTGDFIRLLSGLLPECKVVVRVTDVSARVPLHLKRYLNRAFFVMLLRYGLTVASVDACDRELVEIARDRRTRLLRIVHDLMEGEVPDPASLTVKERLYLKMVSILNGQPVLNYLAEEKSNRLSRASLLNV